MNNKIVFYIRALFHESILPKNENCNRPDMSNMINSFDNFSNISAIDYRKAVHDIQIKNLSKISNRFIVNNAEISNRKYNYTFSILQSKTVELLSQLNDDDIVVIMDDDDWLSPEISNLTFEENALTCWNTISLGHSSLGKINIFKHLINQELPNVLITDEQIRLSKNLLSNCQAISAKIIKQLINLNSINELQTLLQRHNLIRGIIRQKPICNWNVKEDLLPDILSIYVRHAVNVTLFERMGGYSVESFTFDKYKEVVYPYKYADYENIPNFPDYLNWAYPYLEELRQLNQQL